MPLATVDHVSRRRTGRLAVRDAQQRRDRARAGASRDAARVPVTLLGGGSNVLMADAGVRGLVIRPRGGDISQARRRSRSRRCGRHDQRPRALDDHCTAAPASKPGPARRARSAAPFSATRISAAGSSAIWSLRSGWSIRRGRCPTCRRRAMAFGYDRSRLQQTGEVLLSATFRVLRPAIRRRCARPRAHRWRFASARSRSTRRAPAASFRIRSPAAIGAGRHSVVGRRARRSRRAERRWRSAAPACRRRTATSSSTTGSATAADIRRLIERCRDDGARPLRRRPARGDRVSRRLQSVTDPRSR